MKINNIITVINDRPEYTEVLPLFRRAWMKLYNIEPIVGVIEGNYDEDPNPYITFPRDNNIEILGPAEAPLRILRGWYRIRFLVKSKKEVNIQKKVRNWLVGCNIPSKVRVTVDVDPVNFL